MLINPKMEGNSEKKPTVSTFNWTDCRPTIKRKQAQSFSSILSLVELLIDEAHTALENEMGKEYRAQVCLNVVIKCDYSCVMHAVWTLVTERGGVLSFSTVTVENLYVPDKPAGILLSKYTMLQQKKRKKKNNWRRWVLRWYSVRRDSVFSHIWTTIKCSSATSQHSPPSRPCWPQYKSYNHLFILPLHLKFDDLADTLIKLYQIGF